MPARSAMDLSEPGAADRLMADLAAHGEHVDLLVNNAGFGLAGRFAELDGQRQRQMIDLNCGALTELAHAVLPGDDRAQVGRDPQRRLDRRLPARARHGGLFRDQGVRPVLQRGAARGSEGARRHRHARSAPGRPRPNSARSPGGVGTALIDKMSARLRRRRPRRDRGDGPGAARSPFPGWSTRPARRATACCRAGCCAR